jgi:hypothetical protein
MLTEPTMDKLRALDLHGMASAWIEQQKQPDLTRLSFDERFGLLVDVEWDRRQNKRLDRRLKEAKLKFSRACLASQPRHLREDRHRKNVPGLCLRPAGVSQGLPHLLSTRPTALSRAHARSRRRHLCAAARQARSL